MFLALALAPHGAPLGHRGVLAPEFSLLAPAGTSPAGASATDAWHGCPLCCCTNTYSEGTSTGPAGR